MADIIIKGETAEARIVPDSQDPDYYTYTCSRGVWCTLWQMTDEHRMDVIQDAIIHVDLHDAEIADGPAQPVPGWTTAS